MKNFILFLTAGLAPVLTTCSPIHTVTTLEIVTDIVTVTASSGGYQAPTGYTPPTSRFRHGHSASSSAQSQSEQTFTIQTVPNVPQSTQTSAASAEMYASSAGATSFYAPPSTSAYAAPSSSVYASPSTPAYATPSTSAYAPPTTSSYAAPSSVSNCYNGADVAAAAVKAHNLHRSNHSSPSVEWDADLSNSACIQTSPCGDFAHAMEINGGGYGQNIWEMEGTGIGSSEPYDDVKAVTQAITEGWYNNEFVTYNNQWGMEPTGDLEGWGHLTQLLWADSTKIGCSVSHCARNGMPGYYVSCNYKNRGNMGGTYSQNVKAPQGAPIVFA